MLAIGTILQDRYIVGDLLGQGGMGAVYECLDRRLSRTVALKETVVQTEELKTAFEREARLLANLNHHVLPRVMDHFTENDGQYLVMEFIPGADLKTLLEDQSHLFGVSEVLQWGDELLDALDYLHTHEPPVLHRDIKPANLKTTKDRIRLLDFGLAKGTAGQMTVVTTSKSLFGYSMSYAPLEQIQGEKTNARTDLYALAATLYHLLTGKVPADALSRAAAFLNDEDDPLAPIRILRPDVPPETEKVLMAALALKPTQRPANAAQMRVALRNAVSEPENADDLSDEATVLRYGERESVDPFPSTPHNIKHRIIFASAAVAVALALAWVWYTGRITQFTKLGRPVSVNIAHNSEARQDSTKADAQDPDTSAEVAATPTPSPTLDIHKVNFRNVKVPLRGISFALPGVPGSRVGGLTQQDVVFDKVEFGDLDGDGSDEAAVLIDFSYARTGGNGYGNFGYIYSIKDGKLKVVSAVKGGFGIWRGMIASAKIQDSQFIVKRCDRNEDYSYVETATYRLDGGALVLVNKNGKETDDCPSPRIKTNSN